MRLPDCDDKKARGTSDQLLRRHPSLISPDPGADGRRYRG
jgi:hypothetical protein